MPLDLEVLRPETPRVSSAISRREGVLLSLVAHALAAGIWVLTPASGEAEQLDAAPALAQQDVRFVSMEPLVERPAIARPRVEHSDADRRAAAPEAAPIPENDQPRSIGDTADKVVGAPMDRSTASASAAPPSPDSASIPDPASRAGSLDPAAPPKTAAPGLGASLRNLQQFLQKHNYNNPQGALGDQAADLQFDSKGVEFGPWLRRFVAHVKRNWFVPQIFDKGRVTIQFYVHKDGRITDIKVVKPAAIEAFTISAVNALKMSNPTLALPPEYPDDRMLMTATFIYNDGPGR